MTIRTLDVFMEHLTLHKGADNIILLKDLTIRMIKTIVNCLNSELVIKILSGLHYLRKLCATGMTTGEVNGIMGANWHRFYADAFGPA